MIIEKPRQKYNNNSNNNKTGLKTKGNYKREDRRQDILYTYVIKE